eukprot:354169-Chlamydomonas_euryale.AAC.13
MDGGGSVAPSRQSHERAYAAVTKQGGLRAQGCMRHPVCTRDKSDRQAARLQQRRWADVTRGEKKGGGLGIFTLRHTLLPRLPSSPRPAAASTTGRTGSRCLSMQSKWPPMTPTTSRTQTAPRSLRTIGLGPS